MAATIGLHRNVIELSYYGSHRGRDRIGENTDSSRTFIIVSHPDESQFRTFEEQIEGIVQTLQAEIAIGSTARQVVLILGKECTQHFERIPHVSCSHLATSNQLSVSGLMMPYPSCEFRVGAFTNIFFCSLLCSWSFVRDG